MNALISKVLGAVLLLPMAVVLAGSSGAEDSAPNQRPDLVITEDTQIALLGKTGKAIIGSCKPEDPLWHGKIAIKNIGNAPVKAKRERLAPGPSGDEPRPYVKVYVPNNIELHGEEWITHDLKEFGQELLDIEIGAGKDKCRNYEAPPVFDERLSGLPGPIRAEHVEHVEEGQPDAYSWRIKKIQHALIEKGYSVNDDGDYGPQTIRAVQAFFKDHHQSPPHDVTTRPLPPETIAFLFEALGIAAGDAPPPPGHGDGGPPPPVAGGDECRRGVNLVPVYIEIDPERAIPDEVRSNNRVQFTVAIDCSNIAR